MPTYYTSKLTAESSLHDFALDVARGFGALIHMRDEPNGAPLTLPEPAAFYAKNLAERKAKLAELLIYTTKQAEAGAKSEYEERLASAANARAQAQQKRAVYRQMLAKVKAWQPPTNEHKALKADMIRQLTESDQSDGWVLDRAPYEYTLQPAAEWLAGSIEDAQQAVDDAKESLRKEISGTASRRKWVTDLQKSLP